MERTQVVTPRVVIIDVDGVMTDGRFYYTEAGKVMKVFGSDDHDALSLLKQHIEIRFVTGDKRGFEISKARIVNDMKMQLDLVSTVKRIDWIKERWNLNEVIYIGDGIFDHYVFRDVGYSISPANGDTHTKLHANYVTTRLGGDRAVAEASLHIMEKFFTPYDRQQLPSASLSLSGQWNTQQLSASQLTKPTKQETRIIETTERTPVSLRNYLKQVTHPLVCIGPMSKNITDAVVELANSIHQPIPLIASRRQVECAEFGGGYVNGWNTKTFANYVLARDKGYVHLCRDHGGPWQGAQEEDLSENEAIERAKISMLEDISSGFDLIHIDPSLRGGSLTDPIVLDKIFELYAFVIETARELKKNIEIEIGAEQQNGYYSDPQELVTLLKNVTEFCERHSYQRPLFCVVQTGTLVREMRNVGFTEGRRNESYDQKYAVESMEKAIKHLADIAYINGVYIKEHNGDYLSDGSIALRSRLSVGGMNIAPEIGVFETKSLVSLCLELGLKSELEKLLDIFYRSKKWEKWLSIESKATDLDKAIIAGHYTFSTPEFHDIYARIGRATSRKGYDLDQYLRMHITVAIKRILWGAGYFNETSPAIQHSTTTSCESVTNEQYQ